MNHFKIWDSNPTGSRNCCFHSCGFNCQLPDFFCFRRRSMFKVEFVAFSNPLGSHMINSQGGCLFQTFPGCVFYSLLNHGMWIIEGGFTLDNIKEYTPQTKSCLCWKKRESCGLISCGISEPPNSCEVGCWLQVGHAMHESPSTSWIMLSGKGCPWKMNGLCLMKRQRANCWSEFIWVAV